MPKKTSQTQMQAPLPQGITVRMYNGGFGDTFLLTFLDKDKKPCYMLIDCGVHHQDERGRARMQLIAKDIAKVTGNRLHVVAVTHEHTDHLYGFMYGEEIFKKIKIDELWLPWTEDPNNETAKKLKELYGKKIAALQAVMARLKAIRSPLVASFESILAFDSPPQAALGIKGNSDILQFLRARSDKTPERSEDYRTPGENPIELPNVKGVKIYVLGPPMDIKLIKELVDPKEMYSGFYGAKPESDFAAAVTTAASTDNTNSHSVNTPAPFDKSYCMSKQKAAKHSVYGSFFKKHYGLDASTEDGPVWRRIDNDWLAAADELALSINNMTNNTSLVLAIELTETKPRKVLLFAADAQVGNWLSWQNLEWRDANNNDKVTGSDLLKRTVFYKVGHHGSRNATLQQKGLEMMQSSELVAFIPVDEEFAKSKGWNHPEASIVERLKEKTRGRLIRSDEIPSNDPPKKPQQISGDEWKTFLAKLTWDKSPDRLWIQYNIK
jgi:beta-lactamase superfamily II metal-dependent hydrolase